MKRIHILIYLKLFKQFIVTKGKGIPGQQVILGQLTGRGRCCA
jgi:hypothetical protein